jgi:GNAT superfamily N-acetyltransferase
MRIRPMTIDDIALGQRLKGQNRWNQLEGDWRRQLDLDPAGCFVVELAGEPVGTACACAFGEIAWISLVLVDQKHRGQGIGTALLRNVVRHLEERGILSIRLDATPLGQPVYEKLCFAGEFALARYEGAMPATPPPVDGVEPLTPADLPAVYALDETVTKTRREKLLQHLFRAGPERMRKYAPTGRLEGYCFVRPGANAWQLGPIQGTPEAGRRLLMDAAHRFAGQRVYLDVPIDHSNAVAAAQALGLTVQRRFLRMSRDRSLEENLKLFWSAFGPEKG